MSEPARIKGWCPGALRPMESGDGLLVRLRITGGIVSASKAKRIAEAAITYGNGLIDLSARANLQIRGVGASQWPHLIADLAREALIDTDAEAEAVRNVMASPLAGLDPDAVLDIRPIVKGLERTLLANRALHRLPAKFGFAVRDGGRFDRPSTSVDIAFDAVRYGSTARIRVRLGNHPSVGEIAVDAVEKTAEALALAFIAASKKAAKPFKRIADFLATTPPELVWGQLGIRAMHDEAKASPPSPPFGFHRLGDRGFLSIGAPFGRWQAATLSNLADWSLDEGSGDLRLTPWRAVLLPGLSETSAARLVARLGSGFITEASDPRLSVAACSGHPYCRSASVATLDDALSFSTLAHLTDKPGIRLHVSGCEKGCARPETTEAVLVGREGAYDLVIQGKSADKPLRTGLDRNEAARMLEALWAGERV